MTFTYHDVYLEQTATVVGPYEKKGPLKKYLMLVTVTFIAKKQVGKKQK